MIKRLFVLVCFWTLCLRAFALLPLQQTVQDWGNNESATDKNTFPSAFDSVEFQLGRSFQVPGVVYRFGQNPTMHASIYNPNFAGGTGTIVMDQAQMVSNGVTTNLLINGASSYSYPATWTSHSTVTTPDVTITGLSDIVQSGTIQVRIGVVNAFTTVASGPVQLKYYRVLRAPTGHMSLVWLDMLDRSCAWSNGMTTDLQCENANTPALFSAGIFTYPGEPYPTTWIDSTDNKYKLKALFNASGIQSGNCADVSSFLQLSLEALGVTISTTQIFAASTTTGSPISCAQSEVIRRSTRTTTGSFGRGIRFAPRVRMYGTAA